MSARYTLSLNSGKPAVLGANEFFPARGHMEFSHVTVIIGGVQESGCRPGDAIERLMLAHGDLMKVVFPSHGGFRLRQFAQDIFNRLNRYTRVTLVGISGGAKLAQEVLRLARHAKLNMNTFRLILDSAPSRRGTLAPGLRLPALVSLVVPASLLPSSVDFSWKFYGLINGANPFILPPHPAILSEHAQKALRRHHKMTNQRPASTFVRETRALIVRAPKPSREVLRGIMAVSIRSVNDEIVLPSASCEWRAAIQSNDGMLHCIDVKSGTHADHLSYPEAWLAAYREAYKKLGVELLLAV